MSAFACPSCNEKNTLVFDSRVADFGVRRRRECEACGTRFSTKEIEATELENIMGDATVGRIGKISGIFGPVQADESFVKYRINEDVYRGDAGTRKVAKIVPVYATNADLPVMYEVYTQKPTGKELRSELFSRVNAAYIEEVQYFVSEATDDG